MPSLCRALRTVLILSRVNLLIFEYPKEHRHKSIPANIFNGSSSQKHVCLIKEENAIPSLSQSEVELKILFNVLWHQSEITTSNGQ